MDHALGTFVAIIGWIATVLAVAGIAYLLIASVVARRFFAKRRRSAPSTQAVTLLKPLHGAEPRLAENLATFLVQNHDGPVQMLCGVQRPGDPAVAVVKALQVAHPAADITLVIDPTVHGASGKVSNLITMIPHARHPVLILSDSDIAVTPDYLSDVLGALDAPRVGVVSCAYRGRGDAGLWSRLGAAGITYQFLLGVVFAVAGRFAAPCMGSTIAIRRETLDRIGGFERFANTLADDHAIGQAVLALDMDLAVPPMVVTHAFDETSLAALWRHEVRWGVTVRDVAFWSYVGTSIGLPLPFALIASFFAPAIGLPLVIGALATRLLVVRTMDTAIGASATALERNRFWLAIVHDLLGFAVYVASFFARSVDWRGARLKSREGRLESDLISAPEQQPR